MNCDASFAAKKETKVLGATELGATKSEVVRSLGKPDSPQQYDFYYTKGDSELIVSFNDKTKFVESIIVKGKSLKYSVNGIRVGDSKTKVSDLYGFPETVNRYDKGQTECWKYPSMNVNFCIQNGKVASFSVSNCNVKK